MSFLEYCVILSWISRATYQSGTIPYFECFTIGEKYRELPGLGFTFNLGDLTSAYFIRNPKLLMNVA